MLRGRGRRRAAVLAASAKRVKSVLVCTLVACVAALALAAGSASALTGHKFLASLTPTPPFVGPTAVAVDNSTGNTFVSDSQANRIDVFNAAGEFVTSFTDESFT